jgi:putative peptidoglycan lipid II flippase
MLQGNIVIERAVASIIGLAVISALDYARFISETLILLVSIPVGFAGLSHWSGRTATEIRAGLQRTVLVIAVLVVPISVFLAAHSHQVVRLIYARGQFDENSVRVTGDILFGVSLGLWAQVVGYVLVKALNAQLRNREVLWVMMGALIANTIFILCLHPIWGAMTLGLGTSVYGVVLLIGTMTALGLWRKFLVDGWTMIAGSLGYLVIDHWLPQVNQATYQFGLSVGFALIYWMCWVVAVPSLRTIVLTTLLPRLRDA